MGKLQSDDKHLNLVPKKPEPDSPPEIPPRAKKSEKGPALPEKPQHLRTQSSQTRKPLKPRILNLEKFPFTKREVLVAACRAGRDKPVDRRQREPPKLITGDAKKVPHDVGWTFSISSSEKPKPAQRDLPALPSKAPTARVDESKNTPTRWTSEEVLLPKRTQKLSSVKRPNRPVQPVLLIPRNLVTWRSVPVSYTLWTQRDIVRAKPAKNQSSNNGKSGTSSRTRSGSVARSGSLTSQGSSSSDSGGETFPKSVLKKQKRVERGSNPVAKEVTNRRVDQKKNVTFNAFASVQLVDE